MRKAKDSALLEAEKALRELDELAQEARKTWGKGCVYVMAAPGVEAVRIGRTVDLPQRLRRFEYKYFPPEIIMVGRCNALEGNAKWAEAEIFRLLDDIHLSRHNVQLYAELVWVGGYDWYLPDRRRLKEAFWSLWQGTSPRFVHVQREPTFERFTNEYPIYSVPDQLLRVVDDF